MKIVKRFVLPSVVLGTVALVACITDDFKVGPGTNDLPDTSTLPDVTIPDDTSTTDASTDAPTLLDLDGGAIVDGGDITPGDSGVIVDPDAGYDAGPSCTPLSTKNEVLSTCSQTAPSFSGGTIAAGRYELAAVAVQGDALDCGRAFKADTFRTVLTVTAGKVADSYNFKFSEIVVNAGGTARALRYDLLASVSQKAQLTLVPDAPCDTGASKRVTGFTATGIKGSSQLVLMFPYGKGGSAAYLFKQ